MVFIFEAPDNCGKSTQIDLLRKYLWNKCGLIPQVLHCSNFNFIEKDKIKEYSSKYYNSLVDTVTLTLDGFAFPDDLILDRSWIGEYVYAPMYRGYDGSYVFKFEKDYELDRDDDICLITLIADEEELIKRDDGKSFSINIDKKREEIHRFCEAHEKSNINPSNKLLLDNTGLSIEETHQLIINFLEKTWNLKKQK